MIVYILLGWILISGALLYHDVRAINKVIIDCRKEILITIKHIDFVEERMLDSISILAHQIDELKEGTEDALRNIEKQISNKGV